MATEPKHRNPPRNEADLEKRVRLWCAYTGWKRKKMSSPSSKGTLDDYMVKDGRHVWIELKMPGNTPTELQWDEIDDLRMHGAEAYWADSLEQVKWILSCRGPAWKDPDYLEMLRPQQRWLL